MKIEVSTAMDIDAPIKPILDGLNGQAIDDDRNILKLTVIKEKIKRGEFGSLKIFVKSLKKD
jgi:Holliday junction resolvase RusA-like endonuclease